MENDATFHDTVIAKLTELQVGQVEIVKRLDKVNGNISHLYDRTTANEKALLSHTITCPNIEVIKEQGEKLEELDRGLSLGRHPGSVEMRQRIETLEKIAERCQAVQRTEADIKSQENSKKNRLLDNIVIPLVKMLGIGLLILFFLHSNEILDGLK